MIVALLQVKNQKVKVEMFGIGPTELCIVGAVALLLFGKRLPSVARSLGQSVLELRKGMSEAFAEDVK